MISEIEVRKAVNGYTIRILRGTHIKDGATGETYTSFTPETFVFEKLPKLQRALKLFASDLATEDNQVPF